REEVIILLTVHILTDTPEENARFAALLDDIERIRVGTRRGLLAWGRDRLAQAYYQEALCQLDQGHPDRALLNVRMALHNHPRHLAAIKLKEELLGRTNWDDDGSRIRSLAHEMIGPQSRQPVDQVLQAWLRPPEDVRLYSTPAPQWPSLDMIK